MPKKLDNVNPYLTPGMCKIIRQIRDSEDQELICATPGGWWIDSDQVNAQNCFRLLKLCLIRRIDPQNHEDYQIYQIYPEALKMLVDANHVPSIVMAIKTGKIQLR